jgi:hypothetical protein
MLRELLSQTAQLRAGMRSRPELIILHEPSVPRSVIDEALRRATAGAEGPFDVRIVGTSGSSYYDQKNIGARLASRDYVLFVDSDVVPEPGWLAALLSSLGPRVRIVGGSTYVDPKSFFGRAFALFWFFPPRLEAAGLKRSGFFYANNVLFERNLFLAYEFPDLPLYRGHCTALAEKLRRSRIPLFMRLDARVSHAPPSPREFIHRALSEGHDVAVRAHLQGESSGSGARELRRQFQNLRKRVNIRRDHLKLPAKETAVALSLASAYATLRFVGQQLAARSPERAGKFLGISSANAISQISGSGPQKLERPTEP